MSAIPDLELNLFVTTVDVAISRANRGDVGGGQDDALRPAALGGSA
jgi:hypothetical protein